MPQYSGWKVKPIFTVWTILSTMLFDWGWYGGVLYGIHPIFLNHNTKLSSQNSSALSVTMVLGSPFLANIVLNICFTVVAFLSLIFITSSQHEKESTKVKNKTMSLICAWSIWPLVYGTPSLGHIYILVCLNVLISVHLGHLLMCSSTSLKYPGDQACNLNLLCIAVTLPWISLCTLLITSFLKTWGGTIASAQNIMPLSTVNLCCASLEGLSTIVQLLHTSFLMRSSLLLSIAFCWGSLLSVLQDSTSVFTHCIILSSEFSCYSPISLWNLSLDSVSTYGMVFPLTYIMSKSNAMILIAHLKILDDVTLGNSFLGLNKNSKGLWSDFKRNFFPNKKFCALSIIQTMANASFSMLQ